MLLIGTGEVYDGEQLVATVRYDINVERERVLVRPGEYVWGLQTAHGSIQTLTGNVEFGEMLTLVLEDGRRVEFFTTFTREGSGWYTMKVNGGIPEE
jgi:hypothetical protein